MKANKPQKNKLAKTEELIRYLNKLAKGKMPSNPEFGLCASVRHEFSQRVEQQIAEHFISWRHYSGCLTFPVPEPDYWLDGKWKGLRGKLRRSLCRHIVKKLKAEL